MVKPISPEEVTKTKLDMFPPEVFAIWNKLIVEKFDGTRAKITLAEAKTVLKTNLNLHYDIEYKANYLDIEDVYREAGWNVKFNRPSYDESYDSYYEFTKK